METDYSARFFELFQQMHDMTFAAPSGELTQKEIMTLFIIDRLRALGGDGDAPGVNVTALSAKLCVSKSAISQTLNHLEEKGYIERRTTKSDRRKAYVALTDEGRQRIKTKFAQIRGFINEAFARMGEEDAEEWFRLCAKFQGVVKAVKQEGAPRA
jgi:DNA-binding MarR family transcriptional regulator